MSAHFEYHEFRQYENRPDICVCGRKKEHGIHDKNYVENPPAFPFARTHGSDGMTLRDYFAAKAMSATIGLMHLTDEEVAKTAYKIADAMLAERSKE